MIAKIQNHIILLVSLKYAQQTGFVDAAVQLSKNREDKELLNKALSEKKTIFGIYKTGVLKAWYVPEENKNGFTSGRFCIDSKFPPELCARLENEIVKELFSRCMFGKKKQVAWKNEVYVMNRKPLYLAILWAILFGIVMGLLFGFATKIKPLGIAIAILWGCAMAYVFAAQELRKQQDRIA